MSTRETAAAYFDAWQARDGERFRALLSADAVWEGPTWRASSADELMAAFRAASGHVIRLEIRRVWIDGDDAITWFDVVTGDAAPRPVANWMTVRGGLVVQVRATSDLLAPSAAPEQR